MATETVQSNERPEFSSLEASLAHMDVAPRENSIEMKAVYRHAHATDLGVNEIDFDFDVDTKLHPLDNLQSLQDVFSAVQHNQHLQKVENFSTATKMRCFEVKDNNAMWHNLDADSLSRLLKDIESTPQNVARSSNQPPNLGDKSNTTPRFVTFRVEVTQTSTTELFKALRINPLFLLNYLGRPDYWAPQGRWGMDADGTLLSYDLFYQHPRWNLQFQGAPLSVYMKHVAPMDLTVYIISHKESDTIVQALHGILDLGVKSKKTPAKKGIFIDDPFDVAVILSTLSLEASKYHIQRFRRFMWAQFNRVDDHLALLEPDDTAKLRELTKQLQVISQNADSHIANADVALITANAISEAHSRLHGSTSKPAKDSIEYVIKSMEKQKIWFLNYKSRKDSTMSLVYNLVTQRDAGNNLQLAISMKRDSTSMNAIAALTMAFLPGTFTATLMGANIFSTSDSGRKIHVSGLWWLWTVTTIPLTLAVVASWWRYKRNKEETHSTLKSELHGANPSTSAPDVEDAIPSMKQRNFSLGSISFRRKSTKGDLP